MESVTRAVRPLYFRKEMARWLALREAKSCTATCTKPYLLTYSIEDWIPARARSMQHINQEGSCPFLEIACSISWIVSTAATRRDPKQTLPKCFVNARQSGATTVAVPL